MRTVDFVGRNYVRIVLPEVDTTKVRDSTDESVYMSDPDHIYLGAWYRDLVPRLIQTLSFYPRANTHKLFDYSGYDIFIHNILFGNAQKEMNDLMAGEDKFELCYDPYRVNGSALGLASYKGIDAFKLYEIDDSVNPALVTRDKQDRGVAAPGRRPDSLTTDGIVDYFQLDTTKRDQEFRNFYRANVWFEKSKSLRDGRISKKNFLNSIFTRFSKKIFLNSIFTRIPKKFFEKFFENVSKIDVYSSPTIILKLFQNVFKKLPISFFTFLTFYFLRNARDGN
jgi:hypothetical protein